MKSINDLFLDAGKWLFASLYGSGSNHDSPFLIIQIGAIWFLLAIGYDCISIYLYGGIN